MKTIGINWKRFATFSLVFFISLATFASHFRHGTISWRVVSGNTIEFKVSQAYAGARTIGSNGYGDRLYFGDGQSAYFNIVVTSSSSTENWHYGEATITHTYANTGNFTAYFQSCCKIYGMVNNSSASWRNETVVNVGSGNNAPVVTMAPIISMQEGLGSATFQIPAADPDGDNLTYRLATYSEILGYQPSGLSVNSTTGVMTFNTSGAYAGQLYNAAVVVEDGKTKVINDFIIKIVQQSNPPAFDYSVTPANGQIFQTSPGQTVTFNVAATDSDPGSTVTLSAVGAPLGSSFSPGLPTTGNPAQTSFTWTPSANNLGTNVINILAQDNVGAQVNTSVSILVSLKPQFDVPPTPATGAHNIVVSPGTTISYPVQVSDPDPNDLVRIVNVQGKDMMGNKIALYSGASLSALPSAPGNPTSATFTWTPNPNQWGHRHVYFTAEDSYGDKTVHEVYQLVNTPPVFTSTPVSTADVGQPYAYNISVSDNDIMYGDVIEINGVALPAWLSLTDNGNGTATLSGTPGAADAGTTSITIKAEDKHHHADLRGTIQQTFNLTVNACTINVLTQNINVSLSNNGLATISGAQVDGGSTATCGIASLAVAPNSFSCSTSGAQTVTLTVTDNNGNTATGTATVTVNGTDTDNDGVADVCDLDDDNDGILDTDECINSNFFWSNPPSYSGNTAYGTINGINYTYVSSSPIQVTSNMFAHSVFPSSFGVPNVNPTIKNVNVTSNTLNFSSPISNPVLVFASIGQGGVAVPIEFSNPVEVLFSTATTISSPTRIVGREGYAIVRMNGVYSSISFDYLAYENYVNFAFGADFFNFCDTDNDGTFDYLDTDSDNDGCADAIEAGHLDNDNDGYLGTSPVSVDANGLVINQGGYNGSTALVTDANQNGCNEAPIAACQNITINAGANCDASIAATAIDNGTIDPDGDPLTYSISPAGPFSVGTHTVTMTVTDPDGESDACTATVTVVDNTAPVANCQNATIYLDANGNASIQSNASNTNLFFEDFTNDANGYYANQAITNWNVTSDIDLADYVAGIQGKEIDLAGFSNSSVESIQSFTFNPGVTYTFSIQHITNTYADNSVRVIIGSGLDVTFLSTYSVQSESFSFTVPATETAKIRMIQLGSSNPGGSFLGQISLDAATSGGLMIENGSTDNCGIASITASQTNFSCADLGANNVTLTVTDIHGNSASCNAVVTVIDNTAPNAAAQNTTVQLDANGNASITVADIDAGSSDVCGIASLSVSPSSFTCANVGANTVTLTATDGSGNSSTATAVVTVEDNSAPSAAANNITIQLDASGNASITASDVDAGSNDNCGIASLSVSPSSFTCANVGANTVTLTATDVNGNNSTATATVTVEDNVAPIALANSVTVQLDANGNASITAAGIDAGSNDACGIASLAVSQSNFTCSDLGANAVTLTATDVNGNSSTASATVMVEDNIAPTISCPANISIVAQPNDCSPVVTWNAPSTWDNCSYTVSSSHNSGDRFNEGVTTVTYTVTDAAGNTASCSFDVTVSTTPLTLSLSSPTFIGGNHISCNGATNGSIDASAGGGCLPYSYAWSNGSSSEDLSSLGAGNYTVTMIDAKGRTISQSITLTEPSPLTGSIAASPQFPVAGQSAYTIYLGYGAQSMTLSASASGATPGYTYAWSPSTGLNATNTASVTASPMSPTTYTVVITDANGCNISQSFFIDVVDARCGKKLDKVLVCHKESKTRKGVTTVSYHNICVSANAVSAHLAHGDYLGPCASTRVKSDEELEDAATGLGLTLNAMPNPTTNFSRIEFSSEEAVNVNLEVYTLTGTRVSVLFNQNIEAGQTYNTEFDGSTLPNGIYIARLTAGNEVKFIKIVLAK